MDEKIYKVSVFLATLALALSIGLTFLLIFKSSGSSLIAEGAFV